MENPKPDRRIARTHQSLHESLNTLVLEKGYAATTIKDIAFHANVGRSTFYAHHGSKESLVLSGLQHLRTLLLDRQREALAKPVGTEGRTLGFSRAFFEHVHEYRDVFSAFSGSEVGPVVTRGMKRLLADVVRNELRAATGHDRGQSIPRDAVEEFIADALFSILTWWFERSPKLSPAEVDAIFRRLTLPALSATGLT